MAILGDNDLSRLPDHAAKVDRERKRNFAAQLRRSGADALGLGDDLLVLFSTLPAAVIASEHAEYERVVARYGKEHPRARQVADALADFENIEAQAARGRTRAARAIESIQASGSAFFGFVTGAGGDPLAGYKVRLTGRDIASGKLEAVTGDDGYFRIALPATNASTASTGQRASSKRAAASTASDSKTDTSHVLAAVEVLDRKGRSVHEDPLPLQIDSGSAYREYQLEVTEDGSTKAAARKKPRKATRGSRKTGRPR
jgi:hypothetical protein